MNKECRRMKGKADPAMKNKNEGTENIWDEELKLSEIAEGWI